MKGVSEVIGALIIVAIVMAIGGFASLFLRGIATQRTAVILEIEAVTTCDSATDKITIVLRNSGDTPISLSSITLSGINSAGTAITSTTCAAVASTSVLNAGGSATCPNTLTGTAGNNKIIATGGGSSAIGVVFCI